MVKTNDEVGWAWLLPRREGQARAVSRAPVFARAPALRKLVIPCGTGSPTLTAGTELTPGTLGLAHQHPMSGKCTRDGTQPHDGQRSHLHTASVAVRLDVAVR